MQTDRLVDYDAFMRETGIGEDDLKELYGVFLEELLREKDRLLMHLADKDYDSLRKTVHNVKGISGSYKANVVFEKAGQIGLDIKNGRFETIDAGLEALTAEIENAALEIKRHFRMQ